MANLYTVPNISQGVDDAIKGTITAVPSFTPLFLIFIYGVIVLGGMIAQSRRTGQSDFPSWNLVGALFTTMIAIIMGLVFGLIDNVTLGIVVAFTILSGILFFLTRGRFEPV